MNKLGYEHIHDLVEHRLPVRTVWAERVAGRVGGLRPLYERYGERTLDAHAAGDPLLENSLIRDGFAGTDRSEAFYAYKSSFAGSRVVVVHGGRIWLNMRHGLLVGDVEASSEADLATATRSLQRLARRLGLHQISFQASQDTRFSTRLPSSFRTHVGMPVIYRHISSQIPSDKLRYTFGDFDNF